jgi:hypothetical protein
MCVFLSAFPAILPVDGCQDTDAGTLSGGGSVGGRQVDIAHAAGQLDAVMRAWRAGNWPFALTLTVYALIARAIVATFLWPAEPTNLCGQLCKPGISFVPAP